MCFPLFKKLYGATLSGPYNKPPLSRFRSFLAHNIVTIDLNIFVIYTAIQSSFIYI